MNTCTKQKVEFPFIFLDVSHGCQQMWQTLVDSRKKNKMTLIGRKNNIGLNICRFVPLTLLISKKHIRWEQIIHIILVRNGNDQHVHRDQVIQPGDCNPPRKALGLSNKQ